MGNTFEKFARFLLSTGWELVRGTNCPRHGIMQKSPPENHSRHIDSPEDRARFPHHETSGRSRSYRTYQEPPSKKHPESPKSSPQYTRYAATGSCCGLFCAAPELDDSGSLRYLDQDSYQLLSSISPNNLLTDRKATLSRLPYFHVRSIIHKKLINSTLLKFLSQFI